jgi:hypothetical protein
MTIRIETGEGALAKEPVKPVSWRPRPEIVHTSVYLPRGVHQHLREIAFRADCKIHDLIMEGIDAALRKYGHPSVNALKGGPLKKGNK